MTCVTGSSCSASDVTLARSITWRCERPASRSARRWPRCQRFTACQRSTPGLATGEANCGGRRLGIGLRLRDSLECALIISIHTMRARRNFDKKSLRDKFTVLIIRRRAQYGIALARPDVPRDASEPRATRARCPPESGCRESDSPTIKSPSRPRSLVPTTKRYAATTSLPVVAGTPSRPGTPMHRRRPSSHTRPPSGETSSPPLIPPTLAPTLRLRRRRVRRVGQRRDHRRRRERARRSRRRDPPRSRRRLPAEPPRRATRHRLQHRRRPATA